MKSKLVFAAALLAVACGDIDMADYNPEFTKRVGNSTVLRRGDNRPMTLLDLNSNEFQGHISERLESAAWVVTARTEVLEDDAQTRANPLVLRVEFGEGGSSTTIELSPGPGVIFQLPAAWVRVSALLQPRGPLSGGVVGTVPPGADIVAPVAQRVSAFMRRASLSQRARRVFLRDGPIPEGGTIRGPIPPFAASFQFQHRDRIDPAGGRAYDPSNTLLFAAEGSTLTGIHGDELLASVQSGVPIPVPTAATEWLFGVNVAGGLQTQVCQFEFFLGL